MAHLRQSPWAGIAKTLGIRKTWHGGGNGDDHHREADSFGSRTTSEINRVRQLYCQQFGGIEAVEGNSQSGDTIASGSPSHRASLLSLKRTHVRLARGKRPIKALIIHKTAFGEITHASRFCFVHPASRNLCFRGLVRGFRIPPQNR